MNKKSKLDLLVRVRYLNPLPPPPFPPKLLTINTNINRLGEPSYLNQLASSTPLPMLADSEMGMPLDLNQYEGVWEGNDSALNPTLDPNKVTDPIDLSLLAPLRPVVTENGIPKTTSTAEVSWMRNSSYMTRKNNARRREVTDSAHKADEVVDASEAAQLAAIDTTFHEFASVDLETLRHPDPKKKHLKVVQNYDILPDDLVWSNNYILIRYPEKPTPATYENPNAASSSSLLATALLRPIREEDQQIMDFYLPDISNLSALDQLYANPIDQKRVQELSDFLQQDDDDRPIEELFPNVPFNRIRTYDVVTQTTTDKEVLITIQEETSKKRKRGVYYKDIGMKTVLKRTRATRRGEEEPRAGTWDAARVGFRELDRDDRKAVKATTASITNPRWADAELRRIHGDSMIEGQGEAIDEDGVAIVDEVMETIEAEVEDEEY